MSKEAAKKFLNYAKNDLKIAEENKDVGLFNVSCFSAQQSVEKLLKAILILEKGSAPKINKNDELAKLLNLPDDLVSFIKATSDDYYKTRYPDELAEKAPFELYSNEDAYDRIDRTNKIFEMLKDRYMELELEIQR